MCTKLFKPTYRIVLCRFPSLTPGRDMIVGVGDLTEAFALMKKLLDSGIIDHPNNFSYEYWTSPVGLYNFDVLLEVLSDEKCNG